LARNGGSSGNPHALRPGVDSAKLAALLATLSEPEASVVRGAFEQGAHPGQLHSQDARVEAALQSIYDDEVAHANRPGSHPYVWSKPVRIALSDTATAPVQLVRHPGGGGEDMIVLSPSGATPEYLSLAVQMLARDRSKKGMDLSAYQRTVPHFRAAPTAHMPDSWRQYLVGQLERLAAGPAHEVPGLGRARSIEIKEIGKP